MTRHDYEHEPQVVQRQVRLTRPEAAQIDRVAKSMKITPSKLLRLAVLEFLDARNTDCKP